MMNPKKYDFKSTMAFIALVDLKPCIVPIIKDSIISNQDKPFVAVLAHIHSCYLCFYRYQNQIGKH